MERQTRFQAVLLTVQARIKPQAALEFALAPNDVQRQQRARACNSDEPSRIATPTTTPSKQEMPETERIEPMVEM